MATARLHSGCDIGHVKAAERRRALPWHNCAGDARSTVSRLNRRDVPDHSVAVPRGVIGHGKRQGRDVIDHGMAAPKKPCRSQKKKLCQP